jgi:hypothetical protein
MNENRNSKLTVEDYVERLSNEEEVIKFMKKHEICNANSIDDIKAYTKNQCHKAMILTAREEGSDNPIEILIDIKAGEPSTDQVYNAIYDTGKHCEKRVIMHGGTNKNETYGPATGEMVVGSLIECMNNYQMNIFLVKMSSQEFRTELFDLVFDDGNLSNNRQLRKELPTQEQFREAEFWNVYYDSLHTGFYEEWNAFAGGISDDDKYGWYYESSPFRFELEWNNEGAFFCVNQIEGEIDLLMTIWLNNKVELESKFQNLDIQFTILPNELPKLTIKFWDYPIRRINNATTAEKISYARLLHSRLDDLVSFMDGVAERQCN